MANDVVTPTVTEAQAPSEPPAEPPEASAGNGTPAVCSCGAGPHASDPNRCAKGHAIQGNQLPTVVGEHGAAFWRDHEAKQAAIVAELLSDIGYADPAAAPLTIRITAHSLAQSHLVTGAAYRRMLESGGPMAESGKPRRAYTVWKESNDSLIRDLRGAMNDLVAAHASTGATRTATDGPDALDHLTADQLVTSCEELLEQARAIRDAEREPARLPSTADGTYPAVGAEAIAPERAEALLALLVAGGTLSERQLGQLDVLREAVRRIPPDPPEPPASDLEKSSRGSATPDFSDPARPTPFGESGLVLAPDTPNAATLAPAPTPTCGFGCGSPSRCAELKATRLDAWRALHWLDPEEVARRDAEATSVMFTMLGKPSPFL